MKSISRIVLALLMSVAVASACVACPAVLGTTPGEHDCCPAEMDQPFQHSSDHASHDHSTHSSASSSQCQAPIGASYDDSLNVAPSFVSAATIDQVAIEPVLSVLAPSLAVPSPPDRLALLHQLLI